jgi:hypothetical protein
VSSPLHFVRSWALPAILVGLFSAATAVAYYGIRGGGASAETAVAGTSIAEMVGPVDLPRAEPLAPAGPHREQFQTSCTICHSTRLIFTQPHFSETQWGGVVRKMVAVYGAPLAPDQEKEVVKYLTTVRGK